MTAITTAVSSCFRRLSCSKIWLSYKSNLVACWIHLHNCWCFQEHLRMLFQSLRALCIAPGGPGSIWNHLGALVRSTRVAGRFAWGFRTDLHCADAVSSIPFPATSIYQSDTTSPSPTVYKSQYCTHQGTPLHISKGTRHYTKICYHHGIHSDDYKCTYHDCFSNSYQDPFEEETERKYKQGCISSTDDCAHYRTKLHFQVHH